MELARVARQHLPLHPVEEVDRADGLDELLYRQYRRAVLPREKSRGDPALRLVEGDHGLYVLPDEEDSRGRPSAALVVAEDGGRELQLPCQVDLPDAELLPP